VSLNSQAGCGAARGQLEDVEVAEVGGVAGLLQNHTGLKHAVVVQIRNQEASVDFGVVQEDMIDASAEYHQSATAAAVAMEVAVVLVSR
jgi:hypothetical protein